MPAPRLALAALTVAVTSCNPAASADRPAVEAAQNGWCAALAKLSGAPGTWEHLSACKGAYPTASAPYLRGMTKCFVQRKESYGGKGPDNGHVVAECNDEVMFKMTVDDSVFAEAIDGRCERALRCEKVPIPECVAAVKKLDGGQRALLYGMYNGAALHSVADCMKSTACGADEDASRGACYKPVEAKLLWFPN